MTGDPSFEIHVDEPDSVGETLLVGLSNVGMAGITAIDYLVRHRNCDQIGHVTARGQPSITPFADGTPRHHTRLYCIEERGVTALASELFLTIGSAGDFVDSLVDWTATHGVEEIVVFNGVPFPHGPDEHAVFYVANDAFRERRLEGTDLSPLRGGFLDGAIGEVVARNLEGAGPPTGVYVTPTHPPGPDLDAALLFLDALQRTHGIEVDREELERLSEDTKRYYAELAERLQGLDESDDRREYPEDRAYM